MRQTTNRRGDAVLASAQQIWPVSWLSPAAGAMRRYGVVSWVTSMAAEQIQRIQEWHAVETERGREEERERDTPLIHIIMQHWGRERHFSVVLELHNSILRYSGVFILNLSLLEKSYKDHTSNLPVMKKQCEHEYHITNTLKRHTNYASVSCWLIKTACMTSISVHSYL